MSHGLGCAVKAVVKVQEERRKENKGTVIWVKVQPSKGNWGGRMRDNRVKEKASGSYSRVVMTQSHSQVTHVI